MGGNALSIIDANDGTEAKPGDFIPSEVKQGLMSSLESSLPKVTSGLDGTLESADTLVKNLNALLLDESDKGLKNAIAELNTTLKSFTSTSYSLQGVIKNNEEKFSCHEQTWHLEIGRPKWGGHVGCPGVVSHGA